MTKPVSEAGLKVNWIVAILSKDGSIHNLKSYSSVPGNLTQSISGGNISVSAKSSNGIALYSTKISSSFSYFGESETGGSSNELIVDNIPISVDFPADSKIASYEVVFNNKKTIISAAGAKLVAELSRLPLEAFNGIGCKHKQNLSEVQTKERNLLMKLAGRIQKDIDSKRLAAALAGLEVLKFQIKRTVSPKYIPTNNVNISRSTALGVVQSTIDEFKSKIPFKKGRQ